MKAFFLQGLQELPNLQSLQKLQNLMMGRDSSVAYFSWGKVGCLGCFVDSRLQIRNSSNRWVEVFFLVFNVLVQSKDGMQGDCIRAFVM